MISIKKYSWPFSLILLGTCSLSTLHAVPQTGVIGTTQVAMSGDGTIIVAVWERNDDDVMTIEVTDSFLGIWSSAITLSTPGERSSAPKLYMTDIGNAVVGWIAVDSSFGNMTVLKAATKLAGGAWSAPITISSGTNLITNFQFKVSPVSAGVVTAVWTEIDTTTNKHSVRTATTPFGGNWGAPKKLN